MKPADHYRTNLSKLFILDVPLSITFSTSPVFLERCHRKDSLWTQGDFVSNK